MTMALVLVRPLAVLALVAVILGRAVGPAFAGVTVGIQRATDIIEGAGEAVSQTFAMACTMVAISTLFAVVLSNLSLELRVGGAVLGALVVLLGLGATINSNGDITSAVLGVSASIVTLLAARDVWRAHFARPIAITLGAVGVASLLRLASVALAYASLPHHMAMASASRVVATVAFFIDAGAVGAALLWIASRGRKLTSPATLIALGIAFVLTRQGLAGGGEDSATVNVLIRRSLDTLMPRPDPHGLVAVRLFFTALGPVVAAAALLTRRQMPALTGGLALVVLARTAPEVPLHGLALIIGSLSVALASRDARGLWSTLLSSEGRGDEQPPEARERKREAGAEAGAGSGSGSEKRASGDAAPAPSKGAG
jgi:hypothetical protein